MGRRADKDGMVAQVKEVRLLMQEVRTILLSEWNPLGVANVPATADEYDLEAGQIVKVLASGPRLESILDVLKLGEDRLAAMALGEERRMEIARQLMSLVDDKTSR